MSPKIAGGVLIVASIIAGVAAGWLLATPPWGVPAAFLLAAATIGALVGVLWTLRSSWADKTWPPAPHARDDEAERMRRSTRRLGIVAVAAAPVLAALGVWVTLEDGEPWAGVRLGVFALAYFAGGVWILRTIRRRPPADDGHDESEAAGAPVPGDADGWRPVGRVGALPAGMLVAPSFVMVLVIGWQAFGLLAELSVWAMVAALVVAAGAAIAVPLVVRHRARGVVAVHLEERRVRVGRREAEWNDLASAELRTDNVLPGTARSLILVMRTGEGLRVPVTLRRSGRLGLSPGEKSLVERMIEGANIEMPRADEDPRGKFSRTLFPTHLTKDEALSVVRNPPTSDEPLPIRAGL